MTTYSGLLGPTGQPIRIGSNDSQRQLWSQVKRPTTRLIGDPQFAESNPVASLDQQPFIWDCNGFYRRLGLEPGAPRIEVARAYMELDGHRSAAMTNAARVLIDRQTKRSYDRLPLGSFWADDVLFPPAVDLLDSGFEAVAPGDVEWAFYLVGIEDDELLDGHVEEISMWRWMIASSLWAQRSHTQVSRFGVGYGHDAPSVGWIGFRLVVLFPLTLKPSREYASALARLMVESARERIPATPPSYHRPIVLS